MGYDRMKVKVYEMHAQREGDAVAVRAYLSLSAVAAARIAEVSVTYRIDGKGRMEVSGHMKKPFASLPDLPRFGLRFFLEAGMEQVYYRQVPLRPFLAPLAKLPGLRELFVKMVVCVFEKG